MSRLVLDTNVVVSSFLGSGPPRQLLQRIRDQQDLLCLSAPILSEYTAVLQRGGVPTMLIAALLDLMRDPEHVLFVVPAVELHVVTADPPDNRFLECALAAHADTIISGDRHLRALRVFRGIPILSPREYLTSLA